MTPMTAWLLAAYLGAQSADTASTLLALRRVPQSHEAGVFMPHGSTGIVLAKVATTGATIAGAHWLKTHGHPKLSGFVYALSAGIAGAAALHNVRIHAPNTR
jgi:hypothetical protein